MDTDGAEEIGRYLRELRETTGLSLREAGRRSGVSNPYLSQVERGHRRPGPSVLKRLAPLYGASLRDLMERAGHLEEAVEVEVDEEAEVERAYQFVLADPRFRFGTRPQGDLSPEAKRFIVEMYESLTGKRIL